MAVVRALEAHGTGREACAAAGVASAELPAYARALQGLAQSGMVVERDAA